MSKIINLTAKQSNELTNLLEELNLRDDVLAFAKYLAVPKKLRQPIAKFKEKFGWTKVTVNYWRFHKKLIEARRLITKIWFQNDIPDILLTIKEKAIKGDLNACEMMMKYVDDWKEEQPNIQVNNVKVIYTKEERDKMIIDLRNKLE